MMLPCAAVVGGGQASREARDTRHTAETTNDSASNPNAVAVQLVLTMKAPRIGPAIPANCVLRSVRALALGGSARGVRCGSSATYAGWKKAFPSPNARLAA